MVFINYPLIPPYDGNDKTQYDTKIFVGTDTTQLSLALTECHSGAFDGGFKTLSQACRDGPAVKVLVIRRETYPSLPSFKTRNVSMIARVNNEKLGDFGDPGIKASSVIATK